MTFGEDQVLFDDRCPIGAGTTNLQASLVATLVDEWARSGVTDAVVSPGKRSTLLAAELERSNHIRTHVMVDERSGAFFALGLAIASQRPTLVWCTSGTAAAELHPAVIEADHARVPLIVCTADRPPELHHTRDWQAMDQTHLYGRSPRWFFDLGVADEAMTRTWRSIASRSVLEAVHHPLGPGPVHVNVPIREPFPVEPAEPVPGRRDRQPWHTVHRNGDALIERLSSGSRNGVFVVGRGNVDAQRLHDAAEKLGWPVITQARSGCRIARPNTVEYGDALLRSSTFVTGHRPDVVVRFGDPLISRFVEAWPDADVEQWSVEPVLSWQGLSGEVANLVVGDGTALCDAIVSSDVEPASPEWLDRWQRANNAAGTAIATTIDGTDAISEPYVARTLVDMLPDGSELSCSTSMPVRDVEWYSAARDGLTVRANRGVSGLDGVTSTALGVAASGNAPANVLLAGDLGFLYDLNALWLSRGVDADVQLTIVLVDNDGGGIFSMFPFASDMDPQVFERVVTTPTGVDLAEVTKGLGVSYRFVADKAGFEPAVRGAIDAGGIQVVHVRTDRDENAALHRRLSSAVAEAIASKR